MIKALKYFSVFLFLAFTLFQTFRLPLDTGPLAGMIFLNVVTLALLAYLVMKDLDPATKYYHRRW